MDKRRSRHHGTSTVELDAYRSQDSLKSARSTQTRTLQQENPLRQTSSHKLREMARRKSTGVEALSRQVRYGFQVESRLAALTSLVELDRHAVTTMQALETALHDATPEVRARASELLGTYQRRLSESMQTRLIALVWDKEVIVRRASVKALQNHPDPRAIGPLMGLLGTRDDELRSLVHSTLHKMNAQLGPAPRFGGNA